MIDAPLGGKGGAHSRPDTPDELTAKHKALAQSVARFSAADATRALVQALRYFEDQSRSAREALLKTGQLKNKADHSTCVWVSERYEQLMNLTRETARRAFSEEHPDTSQRAAIGALLLVVSGQVLKWKKFAGAAVDAQWRQWLHNSYRTARSFQLDGVVLATRIEERAFDATIESLYVRALLLDRLAGGGLSPKRLELLDTWLVAWMGALWLTTEPTPGEFMLGVNALEAQGSLTPRLPGDGAQRFLSLRPLQRQLDRTIRDFHLGNIFPGFGIGMSAPLEDHVAVIEFLEREFTLIETARKQRARRISVASQSAVAVFFGFSEICSLAFSPDKLHSLVGGGAEIGLRNAIHLADISDGGLGLDMVEDDARRVHVGDLLAVRLEKGKPCVLGVVVRKSSARNGATQVGVKVLSKAPILCAMDRVDQASNTWQPTQGLFIVGSAADGFADSVVVSDTTYVANSLAAVTLESTTIELYLRRVRQQGPGWRMAAYDAQFPPQ